jgi:PTH1 family peptidyl-tRNA hydrolase
MKLIVGLGNPDEKYKKTRHNVGRMAVEKLTKSLDFPKFKLNKKLKAKISKGKIAGQDLILVSPITFMNESGQAVLAIKKYYRPKADQPRAGKIKNLDIWVIYDDIDLPLGKIRIRKSGSAGGHKGVQSIINSLGSKNFARFRVGIKPALRLKVSDLSKFVLEKFTKEEKKNIDEVIEKTVEAIQIASIKNIDKAMNKYN